MRPRTLAAIAAMVTVTSTACSPSSGGSPQATYGAAITSVVHPSSHTGGTLHLALSQDWDSPDPGNTYYAWTWNFARLYARPLLSYANAPGAAGLHLEPDLATGLGTPSDGGRVWTYHIRPDVKYSNGQTVTSADVKYAVERSNWGKAVLSGGPSYFYNLIDPLASQGKFSWPGPYKDPHGSLPDSMIATPNPTTIVFHLLKPFADFDYVAALPETAPVPRSADGGAGYAEHIVSSGPYRIDSYTPGVGMRLSRNPYWNPATDPDDLHPQQVDAIDVRTKVAAGTVDDRLVAGDTALDPFGNGVSDSATLSRVLSTPALRSNSDDVLTGGMNFAAINTKVAPFTNLDCRKAVEFAANKVVLRDQLGGSTAGAIAATILPPTIVGYRAYPNPYATPGSQGNQAQARTLTAACRRQLGATFTPTVNLAAQSDQKPNVDAMTALEEQLDAVGFHAHLETFATSIYGTTVATAPYMQSHHIGILISGWAADWPDGYGFLAPLVDGAQQPNISEFNNPAVNAMLSSAIEDTNTTTRDDAWSRIDEAVMNQAVMLPLTYGKALDYRPPTDTNVTVSEAYGMYDDSLLGTTK